MHISNTNIGIGSKQYLAPSKYMTMTFSKQGIEPIFSLCSKQKKYTEYVSQGLSKGNAMLHDQQAILQKWIVSLKPRPP